MAKWLGFKVFRVDRQANNTTKEVAISHGFHSRQAADDFCALARKTYPGKNFYVRQHKTGDA